MSRRFNQEHQMKTPKPSARERTWMRWRMRKNIETKEDSTKKRQLDKIKESISLRSILSGRKK